MRSTLLQPAISNKIDSFISSNKLATPYLVMDLDTIANNYSTLVKEVPDTQIYYAVKANPAPAILKLLVQLGSKFDTASIREIELCLLAGAKPEDISFGNTIKKAVDIAAAYEFGIRLFAFDSLPELEKIAVHAPESGVYCRIFVECDGAVYPLSRKFGCDPEMAEDLLIESVNLGLQPQGVSFHVGSQQLNVDRWDRAIEVTANLFADLAQRGIKLDLVNLGGGFPGRYRDVVPAVATYTNAIKSSLTKHFGTNQPRTMLEPGRSLVADAGIIDTEILLISRRSYTDDRRWIFLDLGKFGGLIETLDESIEYRIKTPGEGSPTAPVVLAGPTCDSMDILYERADYCLPLNLQIGDRLQILSTGAYTSTYASIGFNGFPPLQIYCI
jgi:ornithine decarboxylase